MPTFTKKQPMFLCLWPQNINASPAIDYMSVMVTSTVVSHLNGTTFDTARSYFGSNNLPQFSTQTWRAFGNITQSASVGVKTLWSQDCPTCIRGNEEDNHGVVTQAFASTLRWCTVMARVRIDKSTISGQPKVIWWNGIPNPTFDGYGLRLYQRTTVTPPCPGFSWANYNAVQNLNLNLSTNTWYHVMVMVGRFGRTNIGIYGDNGAVDFKTGYGAAGGTPTPPKSTFMLLGGANNNGGGQNESFVGAITDFTVLNRTLPDQVWFTRNCIQEFPFK